MVSVRIKRTKRTKTVKTQMAKRSRTRTRFVTRVRSGGRRARALGGKAGSLFKKGAAGVGGGQIGQTVGGMVGGSAGATMGRLGGAYLAGGVEGVVLDQVYAAITGQSGLLQQLGGFLGGGNANGDGGDAV